MKENFRPYYVLLLAAVTCILISIFPARSTADFHFRDSYVIISYSQLFVFFFILFLVLWGIYKLFDKKLYARNLVWIHCLLTILISAIIIYLSLHSELAPKRFMENHLWSQWKPVLNGDKIKIAAAGWLLIQIIMVVNIYRGFSIKNRTI